MKAPEQHLTVLSSLKLSNGASIFSNLYLQKYFPYSYYKSSYVQNLAPYVTMKIIFYEELAPYSTAVSYSLISYRSYFGLPCLSFKEF